MVALTQICGNSCPSQKAESDSVQNVLQGELLKLLTVLAGFKQSLIGIANVCCIVSPNVVGGGG